MSNESAWVRPCTLEFPEVCRTIRLEPLRSAHAEDLFAIADRDLFTHTAQRPAEWSVRGFAEEFERVAAMPATVAFAMVLRETGCAVGRTTFMDIKPENRGLEIGRTWIGRAYHGARVNPEAKYLMMRHAFEALSPTAIRVQITTNGTNLHSQAAIAKLGAVREGVLRKARIMPAGLDRPEALVRDWVVFSIVDDEWPAVRASLEARLAMMH
jgi:ribosomal-protein-alanine N-acetyltransferase